MPLRTEAEVYRGALYPTMDMLFPMADMLLMMMINFGFIDSNTMLLPGRDNPENDNITYCLSCSFPSMYLPVFCIAYYYGVQ